MSARFFMAALLALALASAPHQRARRVHLKSRSFDAAEDPQAYLAGAPKRRAYTRPHLVVQFRDGLTPDRVRAVEERGMKVLGYVPDDTLLVAGDGAALDGLDVHWAACLRLEDKLSPLIAPFETKETGFVVEFHRDIDPEEARALVREHYLEARPHPDLVPGQLLVVGPAERVARLAEWEEVAYVMPASRALMEGEHVVGCGGPATPYGPIGEYVAQIGEGWDGPGLNGVHLAYAFERLPSQLPAETARAELLRALGEWAKYVAIEFAPGQTAGERTLSILFTTGDHGDGFPFDGSGRVLAHTFFPAPPNPEPVAGDLHFNDAKDWSSSGNYDLFSAALHEAGHALGLGHSDKPGTVMYPYYRKSTGLTADDVSAIRELYAARTSDDNPSPPPSGPAAPAEPPPSQPPPTPPAPPERPSAGDTVAPWISIASPASTSVLTYAETINLRGMAGDNAGVVAVTWTGAAGAGGVASGTAFWSIDGVPLREGTNTITVRARDAAGNTGWRSVIVTRARR